jgi:NADH-quinone oxidoreductase subunit H
MATPIAIKLGYTVLSLFLIFNYGILLVGVMARVRARVQGRIGIPIWQYYIDIIKNNAKRTAIYHGVMFYLGPIFRLAGGIGTYLFIPAIYGSFMFSNFSFAGDLLLVMYFMFFGQLGMALGAGESGHPYSAIGVARGLAQMTAFEVPFALSIVAIVIHFDTLSITGIVAAQQGSIFNWILFVNPFAAVAGVIATLGMSMGNPFSVVIAPQEIPIGPPTEFQSNLLGMLQTNRALFNVAKLVLFMNLWFGGATNFIELMLKTFCIYLITVIVGQSFPRFRTEQAIKFFITVPTLIGLAGIVYAMMVR